MKNTIKNYDIKDYNNTIPSRFRIDIITRKGNHFSRNAVYFDTELAMAQYSRYTLKSFGYIRYYDRKYKRYLYDLMKCYSGEQRMFF